MIPFLFIMGLCALMPTANTEELRMDDVIPQAGSVHVLRLSNGVKTYIQENEVPPQCGSFRVLVRKPSREEAQYSFDGELDSLDTIEQFFAYCKEKALNEAALAENPLDSCNFSASDLPSIRTRGPDEIAVIAVGDFMTQEIKDLIEKHFGDVVLGRESDSSVGDPAIQIGYDEAISKVALRISYPNVRKPIHTYEDLKESLKFLLLQDLFQQRMEVCSRGLDETWIHPHPRFIYPVNGYSFASEESSENLLSFLLWQVEAILNDGFFEDEFNVVKRKLINQLQFLAFNAGQPDDACLASYYADQLLIGDNCLCFQSFLDASANLIREIQSKDLLPYLASFFLEKNRLIQVVYPFPKHAKTLTKEQIEELIDRVASLASFYRNSEISEDDDWTLETNTNPFLPTGRGHAPEKAIDFINLVNDENHPPFRLSNNAAFIAVDNAIESPESFFDLPLTDKDKRFIKSIITTMADKNIFQLAFERRTLERKGKKINHVHPLRFAGFILSSPDLRSNLKIIKKSSFKWDAFIDGFVKRMKEELLHGNVYQYLAGFAQLTGTTEDHVKHYVNKKDYEGLIKSLL